MRPLELWLLNYLLNSLWQVPTVFAAAWVAARLLRKLGPQAEHRFWVTALVAEAVVPACDFRLGTLCQAAWQFAKSSLGYVALHGSVQVSVGPGAISDHGALRLPADVLALGAAIYACTLVYLASRLAWGLWTTRTLSRNAEYLSPSSPLSDRIALRSRRLGIDPASIAISRAVPGPVTIGIQARVLLLPPGFLQSVNDNELDAVLSHEAAHMRRQDFAKNLLYRLLSLPTAYHPAMWRTYARLAESREMVCDAIAAESPIGRENYARSLLRLASTLAQHRPAAPLHAIGIFDANIFERRLMRLTAKQKDMRGSRRLAVVLAAATLGVGTCATAVALNLHLDAPSTARASDDTQPARPKKVMVSAGVMAANNLTKVNPKYPEEAKKEKIQGTVVLSAIVGKDGAVEELRAVSGPKELQRSALDAVRQWTYKPYLLNGDPVEVETQINVIYTLAE